MKTSRSSLQFKLFDKWKKRGSHQRLGQWIVNTLFPDDQNSKLFYEEDVEKTFYLVFTIIDTQDKMDIVSQALDHVH